MEFDNEDLVINSSWGLQSFSHDDNFDFDPNCLSDSFESNSPSSLQSQHQHHNTSSINHNSYEKNNNLQKHFDHENENESSPSPDDSSHSSPLNKKKSKNQKIMSEIEWLTAIDQALVCLKHTPPTEVSQDAFTVENSVRYSAKQSYLPVFRIFPWFHASNGKFRQTLKAGMAQGPTIDRVIESFNFFLRKAGSFTADDYQFLNDFYRNKMEIPVSSHCLTAIIEVALEYQQNFENNSPNGQPPAPFPPSLPHAFFRN
jgi:hypothetical protein